MNRISKPFSQLHPEKTARILALRGTLSQARIAREVGVGQSTVSRVIADHRDGITAPLSPKAMSIEFVPHDELPEVQVYRAEKAKRRPRIASLIEQCKQAMQEDDEASKARSINGQDAARRSAHAQHAAKVRHGSYGGCGAFPIKRVSA